MVKKKSARELDWSTAILQPVCVKFAYIGTNYHGLAFQDKHYQPDISATVEEKLYEALETTKLIKSREECRYSRCGRTDKGVHAAGNYFSCLMRVVGADRRRAIVVGGGAPESVAQDESAKNGSSAASALQPPDQATASAEQDLPAKSPAATTLACSSDLAEPAQPAPPPEPAPKKSSPAQRKRVPKSSDDAPAAPAPRAAPAHLLAETIVGLPTGTADPRVKMINGCLPPDIRVAEIQPVPENFDARFSCLARIYRYVFIVEPGLDVERMKVAAQMLVGEHDFRNFCKMDLSQTTNFTRRIVGIDFRERYSTSSSGGGKKSPSDYAFHQLPVMEVEIRGLSFLWHQIRCIMSVLFLVGRSLEEMDLVKTLLDIEKTPRKPVYELADEGGLVLYDCIFENVQFTAASGELFRSLQLRAQRDAAVLDVLNGEPEVLEGEGGSGFASSSSFSGGGRNRPYTKLLNRAVGPSLDEKLVAYNKRFGVEKRDCSRMVNEKDAEKALKLAKIERG